MTVVVQAVALAVLLLVVVRLVGVLRVVEVGAVLVVRQAGNEDLR